MERQCWVESPGEEAACVDTEAGLEEQLVVVHGHHCPPVEHMADQLREGHSSPGQDFGDGPGVSTPGFLP